MRARLIRPGLVLAVTATAALALGASAAPATGVVFEDLAGDGNLLNSQIFNAPEAGKGVATPGSQAGLDILRVELKNTLAPAAPAKKGKTAAAPTCTGFTMTMTLSGPPAGGSRFRVNNDTPKNSRFFIIEHDSGTKETSIRFGGAGEDNTHDLKPAVINGSTITWTVTSKDIKAIGEKPGTGITVEQATTTASPGGVLFFPIFDRAFAEDKIFTLCK